jgi:uncharacterized protein YbbC (DUF1343 family)
MKKIMFVLPFLILTFLTGCSQTTVQETVVNDSKIIPAAERLDAYLPLLKNKRVAVFANNTSMVQQVHLVDTLSRSGVNIKKIFAPEHGFRGTADAGEKVGNSKDPVTGIAIVSLYGKKRKPSAEDLADVDVIVFDIQDVGVRFFTYISSLEDLSEAAIEFDKPLIVLDRPNPNGDYVDGPVRKEGFRSFLGMQQVPVVYGMTIGEYAMMLKGEKWIDSAIRKKSRNDLNLTVIPCANYTHNSKYILPVKPSPNLPDMASVYLYPSTCFFEGTVLSEGRGTDRPFQMFGHPKLPDTLISFTPTSRQGARNTKLLNQKCYGWDLGGSNEEVLNKTDRKLQFKWIKNAYKLFPGKDTFFLNNGKNFDRLAGNESLRLQIISGLRDEEIRKTWKPELDKFKAIRKKYLLYKDFE